MLRLPALLTALALTAAACGNGGKGRDGAIGGGTTTTTGASATTTTTVAAGGAQVLETFESAGTRLEVTSVATGLDTVWSLAWAPDGRLWFTERGGRLTRLGEAPETLRGVEESGEAGLMGLEIDGQGRRFVMYTGSSDNRVVELRRDGSQRVLVDGIAKADIHDGGRLRLGDDGALYASTGDAGNTGLAQRRDSLNGKVLRIDPDSGASTVFSRGHRNVQGLCVAGDGRLLATEHGPAEGDEINVISQGFNGGWPDRVGNGISNYTPTIAPAGCAVYRADLIRAWKGSMLFVTLKDANLHRLSFGPGGSVTG
ncbi:MAG: PQQ-dependent sugar dehydrogenase, partial [Acidimicrobiales bacterium]